MATRYYNQDGNEVTREDVERAFNEQRAVLRWQHGNWENYATLVICPNAEAAKIEAKRDTRGACWSVAEECWSAWPRDLVETLCAAAGALSYD